MAIDANDSSTFIYCGALSAYGTHKRSNPIAQGDAKLRSCAINSKLRRRETAPLRRFCIDAPTLFSRAGTG
jgi:hypothetical protein